MKVEVNGKRYEMVTLEDLSLDECVTIERVSGRTFDELGLGNGQLSVASLKGLLTVTVQRAEPNVSEAEITEALGRIKFTELGEQVIAEQKRAKAAKAEQEGEQSPPPIPSEPDELNEPAGEPGDEESAPSPEPADPPSTGEPDSATGSGSGPETWGDSPPASLRIASGS